VATVLSFLLLRFPHNPSRYSMRGSAGEVSVYNSRPRDQQTPGHRLCTARLAAPRPAPLSEEDS
jgi:hypothetical protein